MTTYYERRKQVNKQTRKSKVSGRTFPKKRKRVTPRVTQPRRSWEEIVERLSASKSGKTSVVMGSVGSAQVTRCRLVKEYEGLTISTKGDVVHLVENRRRKK